jgi:hypothetical protein
MPCQCLHVAASALEVLEVKDDTMDLASIDSVMDVHQQVVAQCSKILACRSCTERSEHMMLLAMASDKLTNLCKKAATKCVQELQRGNGSREEQEGNRQDLGKSRGGGGGVYHHPPAQLFLGKYEVDHPSERGFLIQALIMLRLKALATFLARLRVIAMIGRRETQLAMLQSCMRRVAELAKQMRQSEPWLVLNNFEVEIDNENAQGTL